MAGTGLFWTASSTVLFAALQIAKHEPWGMSILLIVLPAMITAGPIRRGRSKTRRRQSGANAQLVARLRSQISLAPEDDIRAARLR